MHGTNVKKKRKDKEKKTEIIILVSDKFSQFETRTLECYHRAAIMNGLISNFTSYPNFHIDTNIWK